MKFCWPIIFVFSVISCGVAGVDQSAGEIQNSLSAESSYSGTSFVKQANINIYDFSNPISPTLITTVDSNSDGVFSFSLDSNVTTLKLVTSGGHYTDPITLANVAMGAYSLKSIVIPDDQIQISLASDLFVGLLDCVIEKSSYQDNALYFAKSVFADIFDFDVVTSFDLLLGEDKEDSDENIFWSAMNLAFANMAVIQRAQSAIALEQIYQTNLADHCSLIFDTPVISKNYTTPKESFRQDYLNALAGTVSLSTYLDLFGNTDFAERIERIRNNSSFVFEFETYDEN